MIGEEGGGEDVELGENLDEYMYMAVYKAIVYILNLHLFIPFSYLAYWLYRWKTVSYFFFLCRRFQKVK